MHKLKVTQFIHWFNTCTREDKEIKIQIFYISKDVIGAINNITCLDEQ